MVSDVATREMLKALRRAGWSYSRDAGGSHTIWACPSGRHRTTVVEGHRTTSAGVRRTIERAMKDCDCEEGRR